MWMWISWGTKGLAKSFYNLLRESKTQPQQQFMDPYEVSRLKPALLLD